MATSEVMPLTLMAAEKKILNEEVASATISMLLEFGATLADVKNEWVGMGMNAEEADGYINRWLYADAT
jgi:hypothetical protein